ncbi:MAG: hypothetical protein K0R63_409 [Rickettsiales bacterium]|nr:hypothetical protein [Rickettsiales bacterium]
MTIHLIKLSVGPETLSDLAAWQAECLRGMQQNRQKPELIHVTRHMPKRAKELLDGGSIYWVIKGWICARQRLRELRPLLRDGVPYCGLVCDTELVRVAPRPHRPFQGWRYFDSKDAPPDLIKGKDDDDMPDEMRRELTALGVL